MIYTQYFCGKCGSDRIRRNGSKNGQPKYQYTVCRYQNLFMLAAAHKAAQYAQVNALLMKRNSQRSIVRATSMARMTLAKRLKKATMPAFPLPRLRPKRVQKKH